MVVVELSTTMVIIHGTVGEHDRTISYTQIQYQNEFVLKCECQFVLQPVNEGITPGWFNRGQPGEQHSKLSKKPKSQNWLAWWARP